MTTEQELQPSHDIPERDPSMSKTDRDYLEMLMCKVQQMKLHGQNYFARKMQADERLYAQSKKELNEFLTILKRRGFSGDRFINKPVQGKIL